MTNPQGTPVWYELLTTDIDAAQSFYATVIGWNVAPSTTDVGGDGPPDYRIATAPDGDTIAGMMRLPAGAPMPPRWLFYVGVDDVDATVDAIVAAGGAQHMSAVDMPGVGRMAMVADPHGTMFYVMKGEGEGSNAFYQGAHGDGPRVTGHAVWNELTAPDQDAAMAFYEPLFGWRHESGMPMGPLGDYKFIQSGAQMIGATMPSMAGVDDGWRFYFEVDDADAAVTRITDGGGSVLQGPDEIPGGAFSVIAQDPQGVRFGVVGPRA
jgi:predicted enzyme related to lactoylglutathione lyase